VNGLSGSGVYTVVISAASSTTTTTTPVTSGTSGPVIKAGALTGVAGRALSGAIGITDATSKTIMVNISGAPLGMMFVANGTTISVVWAAPVAGSYSLRLTATDGNGASASAVIPVTISSR
jgi:hypothetical protein